MYLLFGIKGLRTAGFVLGLLLIAALFPTKIYSEVASVYLSDIVGLTPLGNLGVDHPITFVINTQSDGSLSSVLGSTNGFRLYSADVVAWQIPTYSWNNASQLYQAYDGGRFMSPFSLDGSGVDTIGFGGLAIFGGTVGSFDDPTFTISTQFDSSEAAGRTFLSIQQHTDRAMTGHGCLPNRPFFTQHGVGVLLVITM